MSLSRRHLIALTAGAAAAQLGISRAANASAIMDQASATKASEASAQAAREAADLAAREAASQAADAGQAASAQPAGAGRIIDRQLVVPADRAYAYLDVVMDAYAQGDELRLLQSYNNESGLMTTAFTYDNALAAIAYLSRPTPANIKRAMTIGDTLLWIQANDEAFTDGRVRQAYAAGPMIFYGWFPEFTGLVRGDGKAAFLWPFGFSGTSTGDAAWAGLALAQLYGRTCQQRYLDGAVAIGRWIEGRLSPYPYGGFHGGVKADGVTPQTWCSTEHNIDVYALFRLLAKHTRDRRWNSGAQKARAFVQAMWNKDHFWTGTQEAAPAEINKSILPEDVNSWAYLSLGDSWITRALSWNERNLFNDDNGIKGVTFSDVSKSLSSAVWPEGNGHMAAALYQKQDKAGAVRYLLETVEAQELLGAGQTVGRTSDPVNGRLSNPGDGGTWTGSPLPAKSGIVSATKTFDTGFGFSYFPNQHVGATAWFLIAAHGVNPYREL